MKSVIQTLINIATRPFRVKERALVSFKYDVQCVGPDGKIKWSESFTNLVTTAGR